ncbi:hypothetical protein SUDANB38_02337 [Streptomyces sp. enrichment culture]
MGSRPDSVSGTCQVLVVLVVLLAGGGAVRLGSAGAGRPVRPPSLAGRGPVVRPSRGGG